MVRDTRVDHFRFTGRDYGSGKIRGDWDWCVLQTRQFNCLIMKSVIISKAFWLTPFLFLERISMTSLTSYLINSSTTIPSISAVNAGTSLSTFKILSGV